MLRIQLSLNANENLGEIHIQRSGDGDRDAAEFEDYNVTYFRGPWKMDKHPVVRRLIPKFDRSKGAWKLVQKALNALILSGELKTDA